MKNSLRRIFALLMAVMMIAALGMSAFAADYEVGFDKTLTKEEKAYAPYTTYTFTVAPITAGEEASGTVTNPYAGPADAVTVSDVVSAPDAADIAAAGSDAILSVVDAGKISVDITKFVGDYAKPGIYRYTVTENNGGYAGITYDETPRTLDVYVEYDDNGNLVVAGTVLYKSLAEGVYDKTGFTNVYATSNLTVTKEVKGNLGDKNKEFKFTLEITGVEGEQYYVEVSNEVARTLTAGVDGKISATIELKDGESFTVYGLSTGDKYTVTENDYSADGYAPKVDGADGRELKDKVVAAADITHIFTNTREASVPTGIAMTVLPFVAMIALAAIVAVLFFQKRERREA